MCTLCQSMSPTSAYQFHPDLVDPTATSLSQSQLQLSAAYTETTDAAAGVGTIYTLADGDSFSGTISTGSDVDWIKVTLDAGQLVILNTTASLTSSYAISSDVMSASRTVIGAEIHSDNIHSSASYYNTGSTSLDVFLKVASTGSATGAYTVTAEIYSYGAASTAEFADYLSTAWIGMPLHWDVNPQAGNAEILVNLSALNANGKTLANAALETWTALTGITFRTTTATGEGVIKFDDNQNGAFAGPSSIVDGGIITRSDVNVSAGWLTQYGTGFDDYTFMTYLHEIGHALGLDHAGPYDVVADYSASPGGDNIFTNDSWLMSVMSYFSLSEVSGKTLDNNYAITPMKADIAAIQQLYGVAGNLRTGNTVYGSNSNAGGMFDNFLNLMAVCMTILDDGGIDTLDFNTTTVAARIDLTPGGISSVNGRTNNVVIYDTTIIERAKGGSGDDHITGNSADNILVGNQGNDTLIGGLGNDILYGSAGNDSALVATARDVGTDTFLGGSGTDNLVLTDISTLQDFNTRFAVDTGTTSDFILTNRSSSAFAVLLTDVENLVLSGSGSSLTYFLADLVGITSDTFFSGTSGTDTVNGSANDDLIYGYRGNDTLNGNQGQDQIFGGIGDDRLYGGADDDAMVSVMGQNELYGGTGGDLLRGGIGDDALTGAEGNDILIGDISALVFGRDRLVGGADNDLLEGGRGADVFVFAPNDGTDTIGKITLNLANPAASTVTGADFQTGLDHIELAGFGYANTSEALAHVAASGGHAVFSDQGTTIIFHGLSVGQLSADSFILA